MKLLKGKKIADKILRDLKKKIKASQAKPGLAVVLVGKNQASETYVRLKEKAAKKVGIGFYLFQFNERAKEGEVIQKIKELNKNEKVSGIIAQLPLPGKLKAQKIINAIDSRKDADGFHPENLKLFLEGKGKIQPVFPMAIMKMLEAVPKVQPSEFRKLGFRKRAVVISNSEIFGKTMREALEQRGVRAEYIIAKNKIIQYSSILDKIKSADILITAVGKAGLVKGEMIKSGAIVIDGGITKKGRKVLGDVDRESVENIAGYLSSVPGGVGPVTVACLLENAYILKNSSCG